MGTQTPSDLRTLWQADVAALAGSLVHEIKNPLSTLKINTQLLIEDWRSASEPREVRTVKRLNVMLGELQRLEGIVNSFLSFTQRYELRLEDASVNEILEDLVELVKDPATRAGIQVRINLDPSIPRRPLDPALIRQAFLNLVKNAQEAMPRGGELIVQSRLERPWIVLEFIDTGAGIPPNHLNRVFDLYFSTKHGGSGLGLALCRRIVQEHGGAIEVHSELGRGSRFTVRLPVPEEAAEG